MKKILFSLAGLVAIVLVGAAVYLWTPVDRSFDPDAARAAAQPYDARIVRDEFGVAHVMGRTDADAHFGFAYAHAEDAWEIMEETIMAGRGMAAQYRGQGDAPADYLYDLFRVEQAVAAEDFPVPDDVRAIVRAYAAGLNLFGAEHPERVTPGLLPVTEADIHAAVMWLTPFFYLLDGHLEPLFSETDAPQVSPWGRTARLDLPDAVRGSNGFAVAPSRSADGHTRLIVNSHQPMNGRYAWYEIHLMSEEGLNIFGGTFPGLPIVPQGITPNTAWTHTVNRPDLVDIYKLDVDDEDDPQAYRLDGEWRDFDRGEAEFRVKLWGPFSLPVTRDALWSEHGPVLSTPSGHYALRFAGMGETRAIEQWYRMGKARDVNEWREALDINGVLSFNIVYGDRDGNIGTIYNGRVPDRIAGPDWQSILPGDDSRLIWREFHAVSDLPQHWNPECGWLFSANATPFMVTDEACENARADFSTTMGIEDRITNRSRRAVALFRPDASITREDLMRYRSDTRYDPESLLMQLVVELVSLPSDEADVRAAQDVLRNWDGHADTPSRGAALAVITGVRTLGREYMDEADASLDTLLEVASELEAVFGRIDPEWGEVNRIVRGEENWPLDGAPDVLRAIYSDEDGLATQGYLNALAGDTHIMVADWAPDGTLRAESILQYGAATVDETSPHYDDQVEMFSKGEYRTLAMSQEAVLASAVEDYRPGER
ncbi:penicillin acylase family protein [uncultured Algimonas sp.]|uniref:penicillin acylase family protein n=1 Tax=uncultured Algimonas sp. TaxID=1547920 RepID=UPI00260944D7|nr:penicillin acylase family protein [uncultured Algimonas sp.]